MRNLNEFEGTKEQLSRFNAYIKNFELNDVQESVAENDFLNYEEDTESEMTFDIFKERLQIREYN